MILSGSIVSIGLATLLLVPVPFVRSLGAAEAGSNRLSYCRANASSQLYFHSSADASHTKKVPWLNGKKKSDDWDVHRFTHFVIRLPISVLLFSLAILAIAASSVIWLQ